MSRNDREYFRERLKAERAMAAAASDPRAIAAHRELAERYELLAGDGKRPKLVRIEPAVRISVAA